MKNGLRRYDFSERLAELLGESRRDLRFRVTLMITGGIVPPGPRGPGSPPATPDYAADLLIGVMAAPSQGQTVEAIRCYRALAPTALVAETTASALVLGATEPGTRTTRTGDPSALALLLDRPPFGEALTRLLDHARDAATRDTLARELFGVWLSRGAPVAGVQIAAWSEGGRRTILTQRYAVPEGGRPPAWLDPDRGGIADPGLFHSVFLPAGKLIDIGMLTAPHDERNSRVLGLGQTTANLARHRRRLEELLSSAASVPGAMPGAMPGFGARATPLTEITDFGSNPGNLRMLTYPPNPPDGAARATALVVVLHGCTQTAAGYDYAAGWSTLADRHGFALLLPEQKRENNPNGCFNWFEPRHVQRDAGEARSIREMVERMIVDHGIDRRRVYVTGLSAGGAMTSVMLATYPEVFAGGGIIAGLPYGCAAGMPEAFDCMFQGRSKPAREWGDRVRAASAHTGAWPKISVWHGSADTTVTPVNAAEIIKQWTDVHGLGPVPALESTVNGHPYRVWRNAEGEALVESYTITGMGHGTPVAPGAGEDQGGAAAPFMLDVGISASHHLARFWGLMTEGEGKAAESRPAPAPEPKETQPIPQPIPQPTPRAATPRAATASIIDPQSIIAKALAAAGLTKPAAEPPAGRLVEDGNDGWTGDGWQRLADDPGAPGNGPLLFGYASSGIGCVGGNKVRSISRPVTLGERPRLSYARKLDLDAAVNIFTTASFRVLVDGIAVDEVSVVGMNYAEAEWTTQADIDLARFAGQTVTLTVEVAANSNVCIEVYAKAWLSGITLQDAAAARQEAIR